MFLVDWLYGVLASLGLWQREAKILFFGAHTDSKAALLRLLKDEGPAEHQPAQCPTYEEFSIGQIKFKAFNLGDLQIARRVCRDSHAEMDAVVWLVDYYGERIWESLTELHAFLSGELLENVFENVPFLILVNVINMADAHPEDVLRPALVLDNYPNVRPLGVLACSTNEEMGDGDGFEWLSQYIRHRRSSMFLVDWLYGVLASLGLWQKEAKILFLGLDIVGIATLLRMLKDKRLVEHPTTWYPTYEEFSIGKIKLKAFNLGGLQIARRVCSDSHVQVDAVVYLVSSYREERIAESREELRVLLEDEALTNVPLLILGIPYVVSEDELRDRLGLTNLTTGKGRVNLEDSNVRPLEVFICSIYWRRGYEDGFKWLSQYIM